MRFLALCNFRTRDPANQRHQGIQPQNPTKSSVASGASLDEILEVPLTKIDKKRKQNIVTSSLNLFYANYTHQDSHSACRIHK